MLFFATTINCLDRQVLSSIWDEFIKPEFHWDESHYGIITSVFSIVYAICMLFAGRFIGQIGTKKGYLQAIGVWSVDVCMHAFCGIVIEGHIDIYSAARLVTATGDVVVILATVSMYYFLVARYILTLGGTGNFPAAIKVTVEHFPKKDQAYATSVFNVSTSIGALIAPLSIPLLIKAWGWEMAFVTVDTLGFIWMGFWVFVYTAPSESRFVNKTGLECIEQDKQENGTIPVKEDKGKKGVTFRQCFMYKQTWAFTFSKLMTDGVWWFLLFWTPSHLGTQFGIKTSKDLSRALIFTLCAVTMPSIYSGKTPMTIANKTGLDPYAACIRAVLIFVSFPLLVLLAQPLGTTSPWLPVIMTGIGSAAHQPWSANIFSTVGDMFPKSAITSITGTDGMVGGVNSMVFQYSTGKLFVHADVTQMVFMGFVGKPTGYFIVFYICSVAYLVGWIVMKALVPKCRPIILN